MRALLPLAISLPHAASLGGTVWISVSLHMRCDGKIDRRSIMNEASLPAHNAFVILLVSKVNIGSLSRVGVGSPSCLRSSYVQFHTTSKSTQLESSSYLDPNFRRARCA
ncbi:hypothetical protein F5Y18DRAFT_405351 [Xylariaceae sp. FL1019]|nr:hypothetical protein F5Y18DRAFT_405351 [Xylariaceae sp. FL1019]